MSTDLLPAERIELVERQTGWIFNEKHVVLEALTTYAGDSGRPIEVNNAGTDHPVYVPKNDRLAHVGAFAIDFMLIEEWYSTGHTSEKGSDMIKDLKVINALAERGFRLGLHRALARNEGQRGVPVSKKNMANAVKAIIAAVFKDGGYDAAKEAMKRFGFLDYSILRDVNEDGPV